MSYLIDTNVLSELRRKQPDPNVAAWMQALVEDFIAAVDAARSKP